MITWLDAQAPDTLYLTATSLSELLLGVELLPPGKRKRGMARSLEELLRAHFVSRILPFDQEAASAYASLVNRARSKGYTLLIGDGQIAAVANIHGFPVATRDTAPFLAAGVSVINPWKQ